MFDPAIDSGSWPGPMHARSASVGQAWLGPLGLLDRFETELGLGAKRPSPTARAAELTRLLGARDGLWSRSFDADPIATAKRLLADRDALAMCGWRGEPAGDRLSSLWEVTREAGPGIPDRLRQVICYLARRHVDLASISVVDPVETLPPLWKQVIAAAERAGVRIERMPLRETPARGDLHAARASGFTPTGDGTLQLVSPHGLLAAADEIAAALAACDGYEGLVVIGPDAVLDEALVRHGVPRVGAYVDAPGSASLVRLVVETAFTPMDVDRLHALLCADPGPVPRRIARRLVSAVGSLPARGTDDWRGALAAGLEAIDEARRAQVGKRLTSLLDPVVERTAALTLEQLGERLRVLATWARGRGETDVTLGEVISQSERLLELAKTAATVRLDRATLLRLCDEAECDSLAGAGAECGLASVVEPGAVLAPVPKVLWWGFTRDRAPGAPRLRLSQAERAALAASGISAPDAGVTMAHEARRWRRPLMLASESLVLVCPQTDAAGVASHPHPLWDELRAAMTSPEHASRLRSTHASFPATARREQVALRPVPAAFDVARAPGPITIRNPESPSSLERLLGCSFAYALSYAGRLRSGLSSGPAGPTPLLYGTLAHHFLAHVFEGGAPTPEIASQRATEAFDAELGQLAECLLLPDHQVERAELKRAIVDTAHAVASIVARTGATIRGVEVALKGSLGSVAVEGWADLLLTNPDFVIDYKWGATGNRNRLAAGAAMQLAAYAELSRTGHALPGVAYLALKSQHVFTAAGAPLLDGIVAGQHSVAEMLLGAQVGLEERLRELAAGQLVAPGARDVPEDSVLSGGRLRLAPACDYCELSTLCGRRGGA